MARYWALYRDIECARRGLIWTYGKEQVNYNFNKAGAWSHVDIYMGPAKELIAEAHHILINQAPECSVVVRKSAAYNCDYMGSQRVNFSRGKQIASMAVGSLKREGAKMEARLVLREDALLICTVDQDLALLPYPSITYIHMDESLESPDHLLGIIAVIPEMPPNCILIYSEDSQDIVARIAEKTGLPIGEEQGPII
ncbi:Oidioi.mRNA.OKI2018_I69.chr1.g3689.t1.cds [Oikopleura dioica]|uniref:Oidioi.mRNA.OKI2018_I69.chr1.g3689.t1.cds n=1 Tax=Oikopleura dioica TaxID=34765 RepID=A0ABN7SUW2_OIKDI|nr:Oidioi.mRNA.OKI2018_I69.chr1.g3689.t1.cds [Oikopleura dioica]